MSDRPQPKPAKALSLILAYLLAAGPGSPLAAQAASFLRPQPYAPAPHLKLAAFPLPNELQPSPTLQASDRISPLESAFHAALYRALTLIMSMDTPTFNLRFMGLAGTQGFANEVAQGLFMLNYPKPRQILNGRTPARAYWNKAEARAAHETEVPS